MDNAPLIGAREPPIAFVPPPALAVKARSIVCLEPGPMVTVTVLGAKPSAETTIWQPPAATLDAV